MRTVVLRGLAIAVLALTALFLWMSVRRSGELERKLERVRQSAEWQRRETERYARELERAMGETSAARGQAFEAAGQAQDAAAARLRAEEEARRAHEVAAASRQELEEMRKRREEELNRMHEALGKIANTRRTAAGMVVELANDSFYFDFDKAALRPENREVLSRIAGVLLVSQGYRLSIHGHTDDVGTAEYNQGLSERRAESVAAYLKSSGIPTDLIEVRGFGKTSPRVKAATREARQRNRRVEIAIVDSMIHYRGAVPGRSGL